MSSRRVEERWVERVPPGDSLPRLVCDTCGFVRYENPKVVVGAVVTEKDRYLMCRRAIEPRRGYWTLPAGFMELDESPAEGAAREAREEACAEIAIDGLLGVYSIRHIAQVQLIFRATLMSGIEAGPESEAVALLRWDEIPWSAIAFPSVHWALRQHRSVAGKPLGPPFGNPVGEDGRIER